MRCLLIAWKLYQTIPETCRNEYVVQYTQQELTDHAVDINPLLNKCIEHKLNCDICFHVYQMITNSKDLQSLHLVEFAIGLHLLACLNMYQLQTHAEIDVSSIPSQLPSSFGTGFVFTWVLIIITFVVTALHSRDNSNVLSFWPTIRVKTGLILQHLQNDAKAEDIQERNDAEMEDNSKGEVDKKPVENEEKETKVEPLLNTSDVPQNTNKNTVHQNMLQQLKDECAKYEIEIQKLHDVSHSAGKHMSSAKLYFENIKTIKALLQKHEENESVENVADTESLLKKEKEIIHMRNEVHGFIETQRSTERLLCVCCYTNSKEIVFHPCAHCVCCEKCATKIDDKCPVCRVAIEHVTLIRWT
ncbi:hypothetical protein RFI_06958 [Reticulomyxa filosa]|uniref:RING-type domain-containing protein n=1 Tax=Reticulomyxa filosa TaxID=46433 RepID=X6NV27_RETFI|nr:hypothetical protein RFI_06958 [Reticulomyxa filosa]|eukprot:ETO30165.1 hypothetical protein RFI_06958 [Reticulomyxa filosa]